MGAEIDTSVSKLLSLKIFANVLRVSVSENLVSEKSLGFGFGKLGLGKEKIKVTRKNLDQVNSPSLLFEF